MRRGGTTIPSSTFADVAAANVAPVDFRRPSRIGRDAVVALESVHDAFVRRLSNAWSTGSYAAVELEHVATDQLSIDDFVRSLPVPTALASLQVPALEATAFIQVDLPFALLYLERALGGMGDPASASVARRPTDIEASLITHEVFGPALPAIDEALRELGGDRCEIQALAWILVQGIDPYVGLGGPISMVRVRSFHQGMAVGGILAVRSTGE